MDFPDHELNTDAKLDALFAEYRGSVPDQDAGASFMPGLWQKIEARRGEKVSALDALFGEYRRAIPDPDGSVNFMPSLWQKIEARRRANVSVFRRLTQVCLLATAALTLVMAVVIPRLQSEQVYNVSYVDVLDASHSVDSAQLLSGDYQ
jgi:hypothetical protein